MAGGWSVVKPSKLSPRLSVSVRLHPPASTPVRASPQTTPDERPQDPFFEMAFLSSKDQHVLSGNHYPLNHFEQHATPQSNADSAP